MPGFKWSSAYSVHLPEIDAEHGAIFRLGEELQRGISNGTALARLRPAFVNLAAIAEAHFVHEESMMKATRYPALGWHKRQHDAMRRRVGHLWKRIDGGHREAAAEFLEFLADWLKTHTRVADRMMSAYVRNQMRRKSLRRLARCSSGC